MKSILISSSVLILAILAVRVLFRRALSRRVQYALWALVLVRLLVPVSLPASSLSVLNAGQTTQTAVANTISREVYVLPVDRAPAAAYPQAAGTAPGEPVPTGESAGYSVLSRDGATVTKYAARVSLRQVLRAVWLIGAAALGAWFLFVNLRFSRKLNKSRKLYSISGCKYPVYLMEEGLSSPCLFGLLHPAIYLTPASAASEESLRHVLSHEATHALHRDPLWALLRCVCLCAYWFDPLVWIAALVSRTDCELACDEGVMAGLGSAERLAYGQTLLSLIPVRARPGNPLLTATTMTAGKRQLKDRITRIAENRKPLLSALLAAILVVALTAACTFTGAKTAVPEGLSGDELRYFNETFFNAGDFNLHNQFLSSTYEKPEDIDLFELFYCGVGDQETISDEEMKLAGNLDDQGETLCDCTKITSTVLNDTLKTNTGLSLEQTNKVHLDEFTYLSDYDAYYHVHGDTNYRAQVTITAGEKEGDTVRLYYNDNFYSGGWKCVTLTAQDDGSYWFVSNLPSEKPAIATVYPESDPWKTLSLSALTPYQAPETMALTHHTDDCAERGGGVLVTGDDGTEYSVRPYRSTDGNVYAAIIYDEAAGNNKMETWDVGCFFTFPANSSVAMDGSENVSADGFDDLFGHSGVVLTYSDYSSGSPERGGIISTFHDYYYFTADGTPTLLLRTWGNEVSTIDLDGDGTDELVADAPQIFFIKDGTLYQADIGALLSAAWPEMTSLDYSLLDVSGRCLTLYGAVSAEGSTSGSLSFQRTVYFKGDSLLLYKPDQSAFADHVADGISVPDEVLTAAKDAVLKHYQWWQSNSGAQSYVSGEWKDTNEPADWDDWHITSLSLAATRPIGTSTLEVYNLDYELHTTTPGKVILAGGMYCDEDGWVGGMYDEAPYLTFLVSDGKRTLISNSIPGDVGTDSPLFYAAMNDTLMDNGLLTLPELSAYELLCDFSNNAFTFLGRLGGLSTADQATVCTRLCYYKDHGGDDDQSTYAAALQSAADGKSQMDAVQKAGYSALIRYSADDSATESDTQSTALSATVSSTSAAPESPKLSVVSYSSPAAAAAALGLPESTDTGRYPITAHLCPDPNQETVASDTIAIITEAGTCYSYQFPPRDLTQDAPHSNLTQSEDGLTNTAAVTYAETLTSKDGTVLHQAGTYTYVLKLSDETLSCTFQPA